MTWSRNARKREREREKGWGTRGTERESDEQYMAHTGSQLYAPARLSWRAGWAKPPKAAHTRQDTPSSLPVCSLRIAERTRADTSHARLGGRLDRARIIGSLRLTSLHVPTNINCCEPSECGDTTTNERGSCSASLPCLSRSAPAATLNQATAPRASISSWGPSHLNPPSTPSIHLSCPPPPPDDRRTTCPTWSAGERDGDAIGN